MVFVHRLKVFRSQKTWIEPWALLLLLASAFPAKVIERAAAIASATIRTSKSLLPEGQVSFSVNNLGASFFRGGMAKPTQFQLSCNYGLIQGLCK